MLAAILALSVERRGAVVLAVLTAAALGAYCLTRLPIGAVPDITNVQVQITRLDAPLSPAELQKQVTFVVETALARIPNLESTRSLTRNGFSQVTAIFRDGTDIFFARQQIGERLAAARERLPAGAEPHMGPITTGLGEIVV